MISEDILDNLRQYIREREKSAVGFSVQVEVNGHFLELTGIPDGKIASEKIHKAIVEANIYNARSFFGKIIMTEELRQMCFRIQYVLSDAAGDITEAAAIGETLAEYLFRQMDNLTQWISALNTDDDSENKIWLSDSRPQALFDIRDKFFKPCEVYDRLKDTLDRYHVRYETVPNCMEVCCEWNGQTNCRVLVNPRHGALQFLAVMEEHISEEGMMKYPGICMAVNRDIWGQFYINTDAGRVCYDLTTPYDNSPVMPDWIARQIAAAEHAMGIWRQKEMGER